MSKDNVVSEVYESDSNGASIRNMRDNSQCSRKITSEASKQEFEDCDGSEHFYSIAEPKSNLRSSAKRKRNCNWSRAAAIFALLVAASSVTSSAISENRAEVDGHYETDNTGKNLRDRENVHLKTADQQSLSGEESEVLARVRKAIVSNQNLSLNGKNIKIIAEGKTIFLRGPVASLEEKKWIEKTATEASPGYSVVNQLEAQTEQAK